jgi:diguanylate cyclase (GGDEF)-like protein/PAS domain S-box-containing protein
MNSSNADTGPVQRMRADMEPLTCPVDVLLVGFDRTGHCNFLSPAWTKFTGRESGQEPGKDWPSGVHANDRAVLATSLDEARRSQQPFDVKFRYLHQDGAFRWLTCQGMAHIVSNQGLIGHLLMCFEVAPGQVGEVEMERVVRNVFPLLKQTRLIAVMLDVTGRVQFANAGLSQLLQCDEFELMNCKLFEKHLDASDHGLLERLYIDGIQSARFPVDFYSELRTCQNQSRRVSWHTVVWRDHAGQVMGSVLIGDDVTELIREEEQTSLYVKAFEATDHAIVVTDASGTIISVNRAFSDLTGYLRDEALGKNPRMLQSGRHDSAFYESMWQTLLATDHWHGDVWDRRKDGGVYPKYLSISAMRNSSGQRTNYVGIFYDNSERKTIEERLDHLAHYDSLTGLPNRSLLLDRLEQAIERAIRLGTKVALLYLDLDHFKMVNDTLGHSAGDELLQAVAQRAKTCVRAVDTIARLGGDEFVILVPDAQGQEDIGTIANKLLEALTPPYPIDGHTVTSTPSIGISVYPDDGDNMADLMKKADTAMYQAKQGGRGNFRFFHDIARSTHG